MRRSPLSSRCLLALPLVLFVGCQGSSTVELTRAKIPTNAPVVQIAPGVATPTGPEAPGYSISANVGGSYRLVWSAVVSTGIIASVYTRGHFTTVDRGCGGECGIDPRNVITEPIALDDGGERIDIAAITTTDDVGFDFVVDVEPVYFDLLINNERIPTMVHFPGDDFDRAIFGPPPTIPFGLTGTTVIR